MTAAPVLPVNETCLRGLDIWLLTWKSTCAEVIASFNRTHLFTPRLRGQATLPAHVIREEVQKAYGRMEKCTYPSAEN
jgi:hypothetical protein